MGHHPPPIHREPCGRGNKQYCLNSMVAGGRRSRLGQAIRVSEKIAEKFDDCHKPQRPKGIYEAISRTLRFLYSRLKPFVLRVAALSGTTQRAPRTRSTRLQRLRWSCSRGWYTVGSLNRDGAISTLRALKVCLRRKLNRVGALLVFCV